MDIEEYLQRKSYLKMPSNLPIEDMEWSYNQYFEYWLKKYPADQHSDIRERLQYIKAYVAHQPDFDGEEWTIPLTALDYYDNRDKVLSTIKLSEAAFDKFEIMQTAISNLGLSPKPTFEFIAYLWYLLYQWADNGRPQRLEVKLQQAIERIDEHPEDEVKIEITVGSKHFKFDNSKFAKSMIAAYLNSANVADWLEETPKTSYRELTYILVRTLLTFLPIKHKKEKKGTFSQAERTFSLCVMWLNKYFAHFDNFTNEETIDKCIGNNFTFDQLMRHFKDTRLPFIIPSILYKW